MNFDTLLTRFKACNDEIVATTAIRSAHRLPPPNGTQASLPLIYMVPPAFEVQGINAGTDNDTDTLIMHLLVEQLSLQRRSSTGTASQLDTVATLVDNIRDYYRTHRRLRTSSMQNLTGLWKDMDFSGRVVVGLVAHDGDRYFGAEFTFRIYSTVFL